MREGVDRVDALFVGGTSLSAAEDRFRRWSAAAADGWLAARGGSPGWRLVGFR